MFTPPPSPRPFTPIDSSPVLAAVPALQESMENSLPYSSPHDGKRRAGRRYRWAVLLVPIFVVLLTVYSGYTSPRVTQNSSATLRPLSWHGLVSKGSHWRRHLLKRQPEPDPQSAPADAPASSSASGKPTPTSSSSSSSSTSTPAASQTVPQIPSSPPVLPTPFPQPFDGNIAQNFSSVSCATFFSNMTASTPFRSCRPFSLLGTSNTFLDAQANLTLMNSLIWGTCNTNTDYGQCKANMGWFASALNTACSQELSDSNAVVVTTLTGLNAFQVMHDVACLPDPTSNTYCYINAVRNPNPSDLYYYQLPLGLPLPKSATPTCSACAKSVMGVYSAALADSTTGPLLTGLKTAYPSSAALSVQLCGAAFAQTAATSAAESVGARVPSWPLIGSLAVLAWMLLGSASS